MTEEKSAAAPVDALLATPNLADALESEQFKHFLDQIPIAIVVSEMRGHERIVYANPEFEKLTGQLAGQIQGRPWSVLRGERLAGLAAKDVAGETAGLGHAIVNASDRVGTFQIVRTEAEPAVVDAYSHVIEDEDGNPAFRLAALVDVSAHGEAQRAEFEQQIREKDLQLLEIQHRVKNNLQMIMTLIRLEARNAQGRVEPAQFNRLAGRIEAIQLVYRLLSEHGPGDEIDLGIYLSQVASAVMHAHAVEGIRLDLKVDTYPVSVNVAMPTGLVVNELLTNALKHAFKGRDGGTITLHSLVEDNGCNVIVADDGVGLPEGTEWPRRGNLGALIVRSLHENAKADLAVESSPGRGTKVTITFKRSVAAPAAPSNG